jgi:hypothetical protein
MNQPGERVELQIWREEGEDGVWRCRVLTPGALHTVRLDNDAALSAYVAGQIDLLIERYKLQEQEMCRVLKTSEARA